MTWPTNVFGKKISPQLPTGMTPAQKLANIELLKESLMRIAERKLSTEWYANITTIDREYKSIFRAEENRMGTVDDILKLAQVAAATLGAPPGVTMDVKFPGVIVMGTHTHFIVLETSKTPIKPNLDRDIKAAASFWGLDE